MCNSRRWHRRRELLEDPLAKLNRTQIKDLALKAFEEHPGGMRWSDLLRAVAAQTPDTPVNSVNGALHNLLTTSQSIVKVARGTYQLAKYADEQSEAAVADERASAAEVIVVETPSHERVRLLESDFYESFAQWLIEDADEVNEAVALGGSLLRGKWGTPDVIGVRKPRAQDLLKFEPQIVSAEIKIDPNPSPHGSLTVAARRTGAAGDPPAAEGTRLARRPAPVATRVASSARAKRPHEAGARAIL